MIRVVTSVSILTVLGFVGLGMLGEACTAAQQAATSSLALCVAGMVEKDWGQPAATVSVDAVVACSSLLPPLLSTLSTEQIDGGPTPADRLAPIIAEATKLVALSKASPKP